MNEVSTFRYEQLDATTADFLRQKESNMRQIVGKAYTELGKELYEAQQRLAGNRYDGVFERWYTYLGWKKRTVYNLIDRFVEVQKLHDSDTQKRFEEIPVTLSYEISGKSSESTPAKAQAKAEVLDGSIATLKAYRERIAELEAQAKQATEKAEQAEAARQIAEQEAQQYKQVFGEQTMYDASTTKVTNGDAITYAVYSFQEDIRSFIEKYAHLTHFAREFDDMIDEGREEYLKAIQSAKSFLTRMERMLTQKDAVIIEQ